MALTLTRVTSTAPEGQDVWGRTRVAFFDATPAVADYATNGYAITPAQVGMRQILGIKQFGGNQAAKQVITHWDNVNGKLIVMYPTGGGTIPAALAAPLITAGATAMTSTAANGANDITAGVAAEVAAATDLSSHTYRLLIMGN